MANYGPASYLIRGEQPRLRVLDQQGRPDVAAIKMVRKLLPYVAMEDGKRAVLTRKLERVAKSTIDYGGMDDVGLLREVYGLCVVIDRPRGTARSGVSSDGTPWTNISQVDYGFLPATIGGDGEELDVYLGPTLCAPTAFLVNQLREDGSFDEFKLMLCFDDAMAAIATFFAHVPHWAFGGLVEVPVPFITGLLNIEPEVMMSAMQKAAPVKGARFAMRAASRVEKAAEFRKLPLVVTAARVTEAALINTLEGAMRAEVGDWIVTGILGESYPVDPEAFRLTYEPANPEGYELWEQAYATVSPVVQAAAPPPAVQESAPIDKHIPPQVIVVPSPPPVTAGYELAPGEDAAPVTKAEPSVITVHAEGDAAIAVTRALSAMRRLGQIGAGGRVLYEEGGELFCATGFDGDGSHKIVSIHLNGEPLELDPAEYGWGAPVTKAAPRLRTAKALDSAREWTGEAKPIADAPELSAHPALTAPMTELYPDAEAVGGWLGLIEPPDESWIAFVGVDGRTLLWTAREANGGVIGAPYVFQRQDLLKPVAKAPPMIAVIKHFATVPITGNDVLEVAKAMEPRKTASSFPTTPTFKHLVYAVVLEPDPNNGEGDAQGHTYTADAVEEAAHFYAQFMSLDDQHGVFIDRGRARVVESYIAQEAFMLGDQLVKKGSWVMVVKIMDEALWAKVERGEWRAFSVEGYSKHVPLTPEAEREMALAAAMKRANGMARAA
jgi:hypothetical protein